MQVRLAWPLLTPVELLCKEATGGSVYGWIRKDVDLHGCKVSCSEITE